MEGFMNFQYLSYGDRSVPIYTASRCGKGQLVSPHYHDAMELIFIQKGSFSALVNGKSFECDANDILLVPCGSVHCGDSDRDDTVILSIFFHPDLLHHGFLQIRPEEYLNRELAFSYIQKSENAANEFLEVYKRCSEKSFAIV
jgi:hypothetical protein